MKKLLIISLLFLTTSPLMAEGVFVLGLFRDMAILRVDDEQITLRKGETSSQGIKLIEADSNKAVLEINGRREIYKLGSYISTSVTEREKARAIIRQKQGMYMVTGYINKQSVNFLVDTGATWVAISSVQAKKLGIDYLSRGKPGIASTASGQVQVFRLKLKSVQIGEIILNNVEAGVIEGSSPQTALLGMSFLNRVKMEREGALLRLEQKW